MHHSRWASSPITFGPVGRVVATVLVILPLLWFGLYAGAFGIIGLVVWGGILLPWAMRDIWRPVPTAPLDPLGVGDLPPEPAPIDPETSIQHRAPPRRW
jgi:hypothetical protein